MKTNTMVFAAGPKWVVERLQRWWKWWLGGVGGGLQSSRNLRLAWLLLHPVWKAAPISAMSILYQQ